MGTWLILRMCPTFPLPCLLYIEPYISLLWVTISLICHGQNFARLQSKTCQLTLAHMRAIKRVVWPMSEQPCSWRQVTAFAQSHMNRSCDQLFDYRRISNRGAQMEWVSSSCSTCCAFSFADRTTSLGTKLGSEIRTCLFIMGLLKAYFMMDASDFLSHWRA